MILRPEQIRLLAAGLPSTPANKSSDSSSSNQTTNSYQDRRNAVQGGVGISGNGNATSTTINTLDAGAVQAGIGAAVAGASIGGSVATAAINGMGAVSSNANASMADVSKSVVDASSHLADVGLSMLQANTSLANSLEGGINQSQQALSGIAAQMAQTQVAAQNDNRYLIAAGMAVVAIVGFAAFSKGKV